MELGKIVKNGFLFLGLLLFIGIGYFDYMDISSLPTTTNLEMRQQSAENFPQLLICPQPAFNVDVINVSHGMDLNTCSPTKHPKYKHYIAKSLIWEYF